ncbi:uncharacterized protein LOC123509775 [Portunus trituberculatus]|uniref:uncharacterized protein LOC123509775 n=1 Tax=Portunus trituberculatus TaxID=210409 RepID=UPI001E1CCF33|nr:uncharacterized protein LOC123509775 [Portunus trituberculatus]
MLHNTLLSKLDDLYKLRQAILDAATTTTTTTTTTKPSPLGWSSRGEGNSAFQGLLSLTENVDQLHLDLSETKAAEDRAWKNWEDNSTSQSDIWTSRSTQRSPESPDIWTSQGTQWSLQNSDISTSRGTQRSPQISAVKNEGYEDHWVRVKGIYENMRSILQQMYPMEGNDPTPGLPLLDRFISFGNHVYFLKNVVSSFDSDLLEYLSAKWSEVKASLMPTHPLLQAVLSSSVRDFGWGILMALLRQFGGILQQQAFTHIREIEFVVELMMSSGFKDEEVREVFLLLGLPTAVIDDGVEARQMAGYGAYTLDKSGGYGHSGGYGGGGYSGGGYGGYGHVQSFDPFVLLAGLAFATFLAYLIYRLLSTTTANGRALSGTILTLDMSDVPVGMGNLYSWLEEAKGRYEGAGKSVQHEGSHLSWAANHLWESYKVDRLSRGCVRKFLCDYLTTNQETATSASVEHLALTSLAQLFGEENTPAFLDRLSSDILEGKDVECDVLAPHCDEEAYKMTTQPPTASDGLQKATKEVVEE